ncbi:oxidase ustYa family protein [Aspergillus lucknowensis]|uniref:Tat pathway signal sequence n=1 Tax=Aspergillus lucknowensis TaxID=176173 RepID=A0ABR4M4X4_9EURO
MQSNKMHSSTPSTNTSISERLLDSRESSDSWAYHDEKGRRRYGLWWIIGLVVLTTVLACLAGIFISYRSGPRDLDSICSHHVSNYSPVLAHVPTKYHTQRFNGSLLKENIYRQDAGPQVDAAWEALGANYRPIRVPPEDAARSGLARDHVQINNAYGGGYLANIEGFHHLHCLNLLRQSLYYNYDYYRAQGAGAFANDEFIVRKHVSHCLDILRQQLMCTIDIGVLGQVWIHPEHPAPFVDFNTHHRCRNFEDIRAWAEGNQLAAETPVDFLRPPGVGDRIYDEVP